MLSRFAANVGQSINNPNASLRCLTLACRQLHEIHYFEQYPPDHRTATRMALPDFSRITERYGPSVTNISVTGTTKFSNDSPLAQGGIDGHGDPPCASSSASICATSFLTSGVISWAAIAGVAFGACNRGLCLVACFDSLRLYPVCSPTNWIVLPCVIEKLRKLD